MNERIKQLRKTLKLSGAKFGEKIGLKQSAVSLIENGRNNATDQTITSICREFNVNERWLRTGEGEMFNALDDIPIDNLLNDLDPLELSILKAYVSLDKDVRKKAIEHFKKHLL
ncbi:MAG: helix-turn-helix transcriptional regulator [Eubacteriales bacterium]|nr:helix-turn-helix transcriptional regulator [Eubacteriales bacterium]